MKKVVNATDTDLQKVIEEAVRTGEEMLVGRDGKPLARVVPVPSDEDTEKGQGQCGRRLGRFSGRIEIADDFDEWPEGEARAFGIIG